MILKPFEHDPTIFNVKTPELYINMKESDIPKKGHRDREAFVKGELNKCINGININGVHLPGSFYYDINYHYIELDGDFGREINRPVIRDNGWIIHNDFEEAQKQKKHYCVAGSRQLGKTDTLTSLTLREIMCFDNTKAMLLASNSEDKDTFSGKMKIAHDKLVDFIKVPLLDKDFNKSTLRFGYKETTNDDELHAKLYLLNTDEGNNSQIAASKSITFFAFDEIAKHKFKASWDAAKPAFRGKNGFRNSGYFSFTGGNVVKSQEAEKFFQNPDSNDLLNINGTGRFMDGAHRADFKKETSFAEYLRSQGKELPLGELDTLKCEYTDFDEAYQKLDTEANNFLKSGELDSYNSHKISYPRKVSDMFLKENANPFSHLASELEKLYEYLNTQSFEKQTYRFEEIGNTVKAIAIDQYYDHTSTNLDQPIVIIDHPRDIGRDKIYVLGHDPFNVNKTSTSPSRGSFYIMRKPTTDYSDMYQESMVCWYNGRKDINDCREKLRLALKYYGAEVGSITCLHEAADDNLTQWFIDKKIGYWLEDTYQLSKQIFKNTTAFAAKGLRPTPRNQAYYIGKILEYMEEELPDGRKGLWRIKDKLLVKQLLAFDGDLGPCFVAGTRINTSEGYKNIEDIKLGDLVLTHTGTYKKVLKTYIKLYNKDLYSIKRVGSYEEIICTEEHPFLTAKLTTTFKKNKTKKEKLDVLENLKWVSASNLDTSNYIVTVKSKQLSKSPLSEQLLYVLGWYLSDGYLSKTGRLKITFSINQLHIAKKIKQILEELDKFEPKYFESIHWLTGTTFTSHIKRVKPTILKVPNKGAYNLECSSVVIEAMIKEYVNVEDGGEKSLKSNLIHCNNLDMLILGFYEGDGSLSKNSLNKADRWNLSISGVYQKLIHQFRYILINHNYNANLYIKRYSKREKFTLNGKKYDFKDQLCLSIQNPNDINRLTTYSLKFKQIENNTYTHSHSIISTDYIYNRIKNIEKISNNTYISVYNLEVEEDNSYVANDIVVHNCDAIVGFGHTIAHLYKERNYIARVINSSKEIISNKQINKSFNNVFGIRLNGKVKKKSII